MSGLPRDLVLQRELHATCTSNAVRTNPLIGNRCRVVTNSAKTPKFNTKRETLRAAVSSATEVVDIYLVALRESMIAHIKFLSACAAQRMGDSLLVYRMCCVLWFVVESWRAREVPWNQRQRHRAPRGKYRTNAQCTAPALHITVSSPLHVLPEKGCHACRYTDSGYSSAMAPALSTNVVQRGRGPRGSSSSRDQV